VGDFCRSVGWDVEILRPGERGEGALGVVPVPSEDRSVLHYPLPDWAARLKGQPGNSLVFLDEVSSTPPGLQPAIMGLALDGMIAGQRLPERVKRCAAANPTDCAAGGWELAPALANRFVHLEWREPTVAAWGDWLMGHPEDPRGVVLDLEVWEKEWAMARALGVAFLRSHPMSFKEPSSVCVGRTPPAFATPRTWETALRLLASCRATNRMDLYAVLAQGSLGPAVALNGIGNDASGAWLIWLKNNDLPDPEDLLADPSKLTHDPRRPDRTFATLWAVAEAALSGVPGKRFSDKVKVDRWNAAWSVLARGLDMKLGKDMVLLPGRMLVNPKRRPKALPGDDAMKVNKVLSGFIDLYAV
jgi:hypothetical protein